LKYEMELMLKGLASDESTPPSAPPAAEVGGETFAESANLPEIPDSCPSPKAESGEEARSKP
jgi:hypothetical protein